MHVMNFSFAETGQFKPHKIAATLRSSIEEIALSTGLDEDALQTQHALERVGFDRIHVFIRQVEAAFAKHNAFNLSGEFNLTRHALTLSSGHGRDLSGLVVIGFDRAQHPLFPWLSSDVPLCSGQYRDCSGATRARFYARHSTYRCHQRRP